MQNMNKYSPLAIISGCLLALMIHLNSQLAADTSALNASWFAHGIGAITAWCLFAVAGSRHKVADPDKQKVPIAFYFGGLPGAFTVILASITVNSSIGLSGTLALGLIGQLLCSMVCEQFGLFRLKKTTLSVMEVIPILLITAGSILLIYTRN
jgi:transporter family-2 protein